VILGERPKELEALIESRRATGADLYDEVWEGDYHMAPMARGAHGDLQGELLSLLRPLARSLGLIASGPINIGRPDDFRIPDACVRRRLDAVWYDTAALVVEIVSPDDESWEKFGFYADHGVGEVVIADPADRSLAWFRLVGDHYERTERSELLDVEVADLAAQLDWPPV
jgi:Uma2 family endonuclease